MPENELDPIDRLETDSDVIDALLSVGAYLQRKGLRKIELTIGNASRLRIEIDTDTGAVFADRMSEAFRRGKSEH